MLRVNDIFEFLNQYCPYELACEWDNVGLNVGRRDAAAERVLLALDITEAVIAEAEARGCTLIITHHPLFFDPPRQWNTDTAEGRRALLLAEKGIAHIACHTNLDAAEGGVNTQLAACCGMKETAVFGGLGRIGTVETTLSALAERLKNTLPAAACIGVAAHEEIRTVAVVGGSGGSMLEEAVQAGCDTFVTGEAKHHHALLAEELGINLLMLGHYETEYIALPPLAAALQKQFPALTVELMPLKAPLENL